MTENNYSYEHLGGQQLNQDDDPGNGVTEWALIPIYSTSQSGGTLVWQVGFDPETNQLIRRHGFLITPSGEEGKLIDDLIKVKTNKSNRNIQVQALLQARKLYLNKYREGYRPPGIETTDFLEAQLAKKYQVPGTPKEMGYVEIPEKEFQRAPVPCQVKLDGFRGRIRKMSDNSVSIISRNNIEYKWLKHIRDELSLFFEYLPNGIGIDGEIYTHEVSLQELSSLIMQKTKEHPLNNTLNFYIFDLIIPETILEKRILMLKNAYIKFLEDGHINKHFFIITHSYAYSNADILSLHEQALVKGYEGLVIRFLAGKNPTKTEIKRSWYRGKRNNSLIKYKFFLDEEGVVVDITSGEGREEKLALLVIKDIRGNIFNIRPKGSFELRNEWLTHSEKYIGRDYTFKYFKLTNKGKPFHPTGIAFRDYE